MAREETLSVPVVSLFLFLILAYAGWRLGTPTEVKEGETEWANRRHDDIANGVLATDIVAGLAFLVYLYEYAPWHKTQLREHTYLSLLLALISSAPCIMWFDPTHGDKRRSYDQLQHLMMATLVLRIWTAMTTPDKLDGFFAYRTKTGFFQKQQPKSSLEARRTVIHLEELMGQLVELDKGSFARISEKTFNILLLSLFMAVQLTTMMPKILKDARYFIYTWWAVLWATMMIDMFRQWSKVLPIQHEINHVLNHVLKNCEHLRHVIWEVNMATLIDVGTSCTTRLISKEALESGHLRAIEKAIIVDALQKVGIRAWKEHQETVATFILSCKGSDLTLFKNLVDTGGDVHNLFKLVYDDIRTLKHRRRIQCHLREQALSLRKASPQQGTRGGIGVKILSDIDDTLHAGGSKPAGVDSSYPKHLVYPGCLELFEALDWSYSDLVPSCSVVFLSARPHVYKAVTEDGSYRLFRRLHRDQHLRALPTLLPGSMVRSIWAGMTGFIFGAKSWRRVGEYKYSTFKKYAQLYLEYDYVFVGDNGQGDLLAGQYMVNEAARAALSSDTESDSAEDRIDPSPQILAVLIHEVLPHEQALALTPPAPAKRSGLCDELRRQKLFFFRTYLGAAAQIYEDCPGVLSAEKLMKIANEAIINFEADVKCLEWTGDWGDFERALRDDRDHVEQLLSKAGLELREVPEAQTLRPDYSTAVFTSDNEVDASEDEKML